MKKLIGCAIALLVVIILTIAGLLVAGIFFGKAGLEALLKEGIQQGGTQALGVDTTLDDVSLSFTDGNVTLTGLNVANPEGFQTDRLVSLGTSSLTVDTSSLTEEVITIPELAFDSIVLNLERIPEGSNYGAILENLKKFEGEPAPEGEQAPAEPTADETAGGPKFVIEKVNLTNIDVKVRMTGTGVEVLDTATTVDLAIPAIELEQIGSAGEPVTAGEISSIIFKTLLTTSLQVGEGQLPELIVGELQSGLDSLFSLGEMGVDVLPIEGVTEVIDSVTEDAGKVVEDAGKQVEDAVKGVGDGLKGLLPGGGGGSEE